MKVGNPHMNARPRCLDCFCGIGGFLTMPLYCLSIAVIYRDIIVDKRPNESPKAAYHDPDF